MGCAASAPETRLVSHQNRGLLEEDVVRSPSLTSPTFCTRFIERVYIAPSNVDSAEKLGQLLGAIKCHGCKNARRISHSSTHPAATNGGRHPDSTAHTRISRFSLPAQQGHARPHRFRGHSMRKPPVSVSVSHAAREHGASHRRLAKIVPAARDSLVKEKAVCIPSLWDGHTARGIVEILLKFAPERNAPWLSLTVVGHVYQRAANVATSWVCPHRFRCHELRPMHQWLIIGTTVLAVGGKPMMGGAGAPTRQQGKPSRRTKVGTKIDTSAQFL